MKRTHKAIFENLLQEEYNRGYNDCKKAVTQTLRVKTQEGGSIRKPHSPRGQTRRELLILMRAHPVSKRVGEWTELLNKTNNSDLSQGAVSGALSRLKRDGSVVIK